MVNRYVTPSLEDGTLAYKGRRFWVVEVPEGGQFQCVDRSIGRWVVFDRLDDCPIATVDGDPAGGYDVTTVGPCAETGHAATLKEAATLADKLIASVLRSIS